MMRRTCLRLVLPNLFCVLDLTFNLVTQLEQDFEVATNEYEYINNAMKQDLPRFMVLATQFIDPLYNSFYYMQ